MSAIFKREMRSYFTGVIGYVFLFIFLAVGGLFAVATDVFYTFFAIKTGYAGAISVLGTLVFIISVIKTTQDIAEEINIKYMLD